MRQAVARRADGTAVGLPLLLIAAVFLNRCGSHVAL